MATNQLLPFANGDTPNVLDYASWNSLPARLTGFQSGIASSQQFNYILAQGGAAGYVIGQLVADYTGQNATLNATALYTAFKQAIAAYVPGSIADKSITTAKLADDAVTSAKLAPGAVNNAALAQNSVGTANIQSNAVTADEIAAGAVGTSELANASVTNAKLAADAVDTDNIQAGAVSTTELADGAVTFQKIASSAIASQAQAQAGTADNVLMTPLKTAQLLADLSGFISYLTSQSLSEQQQAQARENAGVVTLTNNGLTDTGSIDYNTLTNPGFYAVISTGSTNKPTTSAFRVITLSNPGGNYVTQLAIPIYNQVDVSPTVTSIYFRNRNGNGDTWENWRRLALTDYADEYGGINYGVGGGLSTSPSGYDLFGSGDLNDWNKSGFFTTALSTGQGSNLPPGYSTLTGIMLVMQRRWNTGVSGFQMFPTNNGIWFRSKTAETWNNWIALATKDWAVANSGSRGALAGYENLKSQSTALTVNATTQDSCCVTGAVRITVSNGSSGTAWTKTVGITNARATVSLGSSWDWAGGVSPTISANGVLVLHWCGTFGIANFVSSVG